MLKLLYRNARVIQMQTACSGLVGTNSGSDHLNAVYQQITQPTLNYSNCVMRRPCEASYPLSVDKQPVDDAACRPLTGPHHHHLWLLQQGAHEPETPQSR